MSIKDYEMRKQRAIKTTLRLFRAHKDVMHTGNWPRAIVEREQKRLRQDLRSDNVDFEYLARMVRRSLRWNPRTIPMLPDEHLTLLKLLRTNASMRSFEAHIGQGSEIEQEIIKMANSPLFKGRAPVQSIRNAMVRLGIDNLKQLIYQAVLDNAIYKSKKYEGWMEKLLFRAVATAHMAKELSAWANASAEDAYVSGLLHDIGEPYILQLLDVLQVPVDIKLVQQLVARLHAEIGPVILRRMDLPPAVVAAAELHHNSIGGAVHVNAVICAAADQMAYHFNLMSPTRWPFGKTKVPFRLLGIKDDDMAIIYERAQSILEGLMESV